MILENFALPSVKKGMNLPLSSIMFMTLYNYILISENMHLVEYDSSTTFKVPSCHIIKYRTIVFFKLHLHTMQNPPIS